MTEPARPVDGSSAGRGTPPRPVHDPSVLRGLAPFHDLTDDEAAWIASRGDLIALEPGEVVFAAGERAEYMFGVLHGTLAGRREHLGAGAPTFLARTGSMTGVVPFSRLTHFGGTGRALERSEVARWPSTFFPELLARLPRLEPRFVSLLADRVREATRLEETHERLLALGKLAAGLAHELNNPAAALGRSVEQLQRTIGGLTSACGDLAGVQGGGLVAAAWQEAVAAGRAEPPADPLARADMEDAVTRELERLGVRDAWKYAADLVDAGVDAGAVERVLAGLPPAARPAAAAWGAGRLGADLLLQRMQDAVRRIGELVGAVKTYSHMDRAAETMDVDLEAGLRSTLAMFAYKVRDRQVHADVAVEGVPPRVRGYPSELNQVWTNLLDNALDAVRPGGRVRATLGARDGGAVVEIADDGHGIPPEAQARIWEAFFTTKEPGRGTGLGLEIVKRVIEQRHGGRIALHSVPGDTRFTVWLPAAPDARESSA